MKCLFCGKRVRGDSWFIKPKDKSTEGPYHTLECAQLDRCGPRFIGAKIVKKRKKP